MSNEEKNLETAENMNESSDAQTTPEMTPEEEAKYREMMAGMPPVEVFSLLKSFIAMLGSQTWQWLGLVKNPATGNLEKDLAQAKIAIDTISLLIGQVEPSLNPSELREMQAMLSDLRMNFVQQSAKKD